MDFVAQASATLRAIASLLIFVAGYLGLALAIIVLPMATELILERRSVFRIYGPDRVPVGGHVSSAASRGAQSSRFALRS